MRLRGPARIVLDQPWHLHQTPLAARGGCPPTDPRSRWSQSVAAAARASPMGYTWPAQVSAGCAGPSASAQSSPPSLRFVAQGRPTSRQHYTTYPWRPAYLPACVSAVPGRRFSRDQWCRRGPTALPLRNLERSGQALAQAPPWAPRTEACRQKRWYGGQRWRWLPCGTPPCRPCSRSTPVPVSRVAAGALACAWLWVARQSKRLASAGGPDPWHCPGRMTPDQAFARKTRGPRSMNARSGGPAAWPTQSPALAWPARSASSALTRRHSRGCACARGCARRCRPPARPSARHAGPAASQTFWPCPSASTAVCSAISKAPQTIAESILRIIQCMRALRI